ncbi:glycosyltransferase family 4 protein [Geodermatophilus sabuli]|uniref:Glycosyltransferase involved in cell wall bisynthesis n=1 Tax=Geodermatophilus sabuli TaxID=1564158 RepID=A0A285ED57_9ACTN|nr:glycosyltransferase family 4 protein [Geodermatophilus sabuli]MBB3084740.1 glycosyltransferase involved in cell wall biosynthesis [Geodermatophilus sabuli]SNX97072.1 Glycosyltransferase involved in cell wall bisynthesis [Geodermatophilus sabuli]
MAEPLPLQGRRVTEVLATSTGGVGTHVRAVLPALLAAGADVAVCGPATTEQLFGFTATGASFTPVGISAGLAPAADARAVAALRQATAGADVVHAHGLRAGLVAAAARRLGDRTRPLVLTLHNALPDGGGALRRVLRAAERATVRGADLVLAASGDLAENAWRQGARDVRVAPVSAPPLPPPGRPAAAVRADLGLSDGRPLVVAVGRLHPQKGYDVLLAAAARWTADARLPEAPLVAVAGDGPLQEELGARIAAERLPVVLLGRRGDVADLLAAADVCVLPSRWEARSLTAQEALRSGTPLVATRTGGLPELLGDAAELVPVGDAAALAEAVTGLLTDPDRARALAEAGTRQAATWPDEAATARQLVAVYRELLGPPGAGAR